MKGSIVEADDVQRLLMEAAAEVRGLRTRIKELQPKAEAYDFLLSLRPLLPTRFDGLTAGVDVAFKLTEMARRLAEPEEPNDATR